MAMFGRFTEWSFAEVLTTVVKRGGKLELWGLPRGHYLEIHVAEQVVQAVVVNSQPLAVFEASHLLAELLQLRQGEFEMHQRPPEQLRHDFDLTVSAVLQFHTSDILHQDAHLPDPKTKFVFANTQFHLTNENLEGVVDQIAHLLFDPGCDAASLAQQQVLPLEQARQRLYQLRMAGVIVPVRAQAQRQPSHAGALAASGGPVVSSAPRHPPQSNGLIARLLGALGALGRKETPRKVV
jgi:hypothetical protein